jgi:tripartite-type tricarboxylate transporter receptor subunit TctC
MLRPAAFCDKTIEKNQLGGVVMKAWKKLTAALAMLGAASVASAQAYPARPVRIIVPFAAGGATDILARLASRSMEKSLGQSFVVENRPGGNTFIGTDYVVRQPADGYTLLVQSNSVAGEEATNKEWTVRLDRDITPISLFAGSGYALITSANMPVKNFAEFVAYAKANPGKLNQALAGVIAPELEILQNRLKIGPFESITYKGGALATQGVVAGDCQFYGSAIIDILQLAKDGRVKVLAYTGRERHPLLPDVPTVNESGVGINDYEAGFWFVLLGPAKMPADIVNKLAAVSASMVKEPEFSTKLTQFGMAAYTGGPQAAHDRIAKHIKDIQEAAAAGLRVR